MENAIRALVIKIGKWSQLALKGAVSPEEYGVFVIAEANKILETQTPGDDIGKEGLLNFFGESEMEAGEDIDFD